MDLDRQPLAGEEIFDEQGLVAAAGEPDFADALARRRIEHWRQLRAPPWLFDIAAIELHAAPKHPRQDRIDDRRHRVVAGFGRVHAVDGEARLHAPVPSSSTG